MFVKATVPNVGVAHSCHVFPAGSPRGITALAVGDFPSRLSHPIL